MAHKLVPGIADYLLFQNLLYYAQKYAAAHVHRVALGADVSYTAPAGGILGGSTIVYSGSLAASGKEKARIFTRFVLSDDTAGTKWGAIVPMVGNKLTLLVGPDSSDMHVKWDYVLTEDDIGAFAAAGDEVGFDVPGGVGVDAGESWSLRLTLAAAVAVAGRWGIYADFQRIFDES
jgi:hypothetical protein